MSNFLHKFVKVKAGRRDLLVQSYVLPIITNDLFTLVHNPLIQFLMLAAAQVLLLLMDASSRSGRICPLLLVPCFLGFLLVCIWFYSEGFAISQSRSSTAWVIILWMFWISLTIATTMPALLLLTLQQRLRSVPGFVFVTSTSFLLWVHADGLQIISDRWVALITAACVEIPSLGTVTQILDVFIWWDYVFIGNLISLLLQVARILWLIIALSHGAGTRRDVRRGLRSQILIGADLVRLLGIWGVLTKAEIPTRIGELTFLG